MGPREPAASGHPARTHLPLLDWSPRLPDSRRGPNLGGYTFGFLVAGPLSGDFSDRFGARAFATGGMLLAALAFVGLTRLPVVFSYPAFALLLLLGGIGSGLFSSSNAAAIMNSVPARPRGQPRAGGPSSPTPVSVVSIGVFFSLMIAGSLPSTLYAGLVAHDVPVAVATQLSRLPPVSSLFAALLGYKPMATLLPPAVLHALPAGQAAILTGKDFFPELISGPFQQGLTVVFVAAATMAVIAAAASAMTVRAREAASRWRARSTLVQARGHGATGVGRERMTGSRWI